MAALPGYLLTRIIISQRVSAPNAYSNEQFGEEITKTFFLLRTSLSQKSFRFGYWFYFILFLAKSCYLK